MPQNTNLNISPYFDDFDKDDNFYRVLFRPGYPIQARELTTAQSILQNQIESIGQHFFKEGAMVIPGQVGYDLNVQAIILQTSFLGVDIETYRTQLHGQIVEGITTGIKAKVLYSIPVTESSRGYITLYVKYIESGDTTSDSSVKGFQNNEQLLAEKEITFGTTLIEVGSPFAQLLPVDATAVASVAYMNAGVYFIRGHFVDVPSEYLILEQYSDNPSYRVGLEVSESIVTPEDDPSLNDNAAGTSNYSAPGSHRFRIRTQLVKKPINDTTDKNFIEVLRINNSKVEEFVTATAYSELEKSLARRAYEANGDYVIDTFSITAREHKDDGFNNGVYRTGETSQDGNLASDGMVALEVSPGRAYVKGYRTEFLTPQYVDSPKPRDFEGVQNSILAFRLGQFLKVYDVYGWPDLTGEGVTSAYQTLELYDDWTLNTTNTVVGRQIGRCRTVQMQHDNNDIYDMWIFDAQMWTAINFASGNNSVSVGDVLRGRTSQARGFVADAGSGNYCFLEQVSGVFSPGEVIERDGRVVGTLEAAHSYELTDSRSIRGRNSSNTIIFGANLLLNDQKEIEGSTITIDKTALGVQTFDNLVGGTGYSEANGVATTGGTGSGLTVNITSVNAGVVTGISIATPGSGYATNQTITITGGGGNATFDTDLLIQPNITGFRTKFSTDLRPGDVITPTQSSAEGDNTLRIQRVDPQYIATNTGNAHTGSTTNNYVFDYLTQRARLENSLAKGTVDNGEYSTLVRMRPFVFQKDYQNGELTIDAPRTSMKSISDESFFVFRTFNNKTVVSGGITVTLPESEQFAALDTENYILTILSESGSAYSVGENLDIDTLNDNGVLTVTFGADRQSVTIDGLANVNTVKLTALVSKNIVTKKIKTAAKMRAMKVIRTRLQRDQQKYGLAYGNLYGTRIEDEEISFALNDVYKIHAVYESENDSDATAPYMVLSESTFFDNGSVVIGRSSGARGRVIQFINSTLRLYFVALNEIPFIPGETIDGVDDDGNALTAIIDDAEGSVEKGSKVVTNQYELEPSQKAHFYDVCKMVRLPEFTPAIRKLLVIFDYMVHESSGDYFSNQSYTGIPFKDIPKYKLDGSINFLRDQVDFRPAVGELASGSGTVTNEFYVNCASLDFGARQFDTSGGAGGSTIFDIPKVNTEIRMDYEYYLPRSDKLFLTHDNVLKLVKGVSSEDMPPPDDIENAMLLATIQNRPYVYDVERDILIDAETIRRYTMADIGALEQRIAHVEYYTALSLLESQAENTKTYDDNGFDRLKNGYVVDDFTDHTIGDVLNVDYKCSMDFEMGHLRPSHYTTNVPLALDLASSSNVVKTTGNMVLLPYDEQTIVEQPYASRTENVNPFNVFTFIGRIDLTPASDDWIDIERKPARIENVEGDFSAVSRDLQVDQNGFAPIQWGSWKTNWTGTRLIGRSRFRNRSGSFSAGGRRLGRLGHGQGRQPLFVHERRTWRVVNNQARQGVRTRVVPKIDQKSLGDSVLSTSAVPWIRSRNIGFNVDRLKPRTQMYMFFDGVNVTNYVIPKVIELVKSSTADPKSNETPFVVGETVVGQTSGCRIKVAAANDGYKTDPYGTGTATLLESYASQTPYINVDIEAMATTVNPNFYGNMNVGEVLVGQTSGARAVVKDRRLLTDNIGNLQGTLFIPSPKNDANPRWATGTRAVRFTTSQTNSRAPGEVETAADTTYKAQGTLRVVQENILAIRNAEVVRDTVSDTRTVTTTRTSTRQIGWYDPLAQSFIIEEEGGVFLTSIECYFKTKDANIPISMQIRTMENGYPTKDILPFSDTTINPDQIELSDNAAIPSKFTFRSPVYIKSSVEYCFVLLSDSNEYQVWISRMGDIDVSGTRTISEQPYAGVLFKSQNASTWTADQYEDMKFKINRAEFTATTGVCMLNNAELGKGNGGVHNLIENPVLTLAPKQTLKLPAGSNFDFTVGARIRQDPSGAEGTVVEFDAVSDPELLTLTDITGTFASGFLDAQNNPFQGLRSSQSIATFNLSGVFNGAFEAGDVVSGSTSTAEGIVTSFDSGTSTLVVNFVSKAFDPTDTLSEPGGTSATISSIAYSGDSYTAYPTEAPSFPSDDKEIAIFHRNHGMHQRTNNVEIEGVISEVPPTTLTSSLAAGSSSIQVQDGSQFHTIIGGGNIGNLNPGFLKINDEIIQYSAISTSGQVITVATSGRGANGTADVAHPAGSVVECYNLDGIPLTAINKVHESIECPWIDSYMLDVSPFVATNGIRGGGPGVYASQNVQFETLTPTISTMVLPETSILARVNTTTATSVGDGGGEGASAPRDQNSFINNGQYLDVTLNEENHFTGPQMVASKINEQNKLDGNKSLKMSLTMTTEKSTLSPCIDLDRVSLITTTNRINYWPGGPAPYGQQSAIDRSQDVSTLPTGDQNDAVYITRLARLGSEARSLKVDFQITRHPQTEVRIYYRAFKTGDTADPNTLGWTSVGDPITSLNVQYDSTPTDEYLWKDYAYEVKGLNFNAFQMKIVMRSRNQARVPLIADLRTIALAT
tara:strand:+ start:782 stop:8344 length:7563 start_codon:yes stop_codon:yes gene_type:complete